MLSRVGATRDSRPVSYRTHPGSCFSPVKEFLCIHTFSFVVHLELEWLLPGNLEGEGLLPRNFPPNRSVFSMGWQWTTLRPPPRVRSGFDGVHLNRVFCLTSSRSTACIDTCRVPLVKGTVERGWDAIPGLRRRTSTWSMLLSAYPLAHPFNHPSIHPLPIHLSIHSPEP